MRIVFTLVIILFVKFSFGQPETRPNYKLLWKISGNGLKKPSYLFGTMHVQDNKAFDFSDSVLLKIDACEAFALEIHPDSVMKELLSKLVTGGARENKLRQDLPEGDYNYLDSLMKERTGRSIKSFNSYMEINSFLTEQYGQKDKETFLDSWLYNIAQNQDKYILGLESVTDQMNVLENNFEGTYEELKEFLGSSYEEGRKKYQRMLDIYYGGDIEEIDKYMRKNSGSDFYEAVVTKRNVAMANGIDRAVQARTTFFAVGAGHLAGSDGIIQLLKKKGYEVTPVESTFTGLAAGYKQSATRPKWIVYSAPDAGYSIEMPHAPVPLKMPQLPMAFQGSMDFGSMTIFMATHLPIQQTQQDKRSELLDAMTKGVSTTSEIKHVRKITIDGHEGRDLEIESNDFVFRVQIIVRDAFAYLLMAGSTDATARGENANRFFTSLKFSSITPKRHATTTYTQQAGAFSINMLENVVEQTITPPNAPRYKTNVFFSVDEQTQETFLIRYNDFPPGLVSQDDLLYMQESLQVVLTNLKGDNLETQPMEFNGFAGLRYQFNAYEGKFNAMGNTILRGNRFYMTLALRPAEGNPIASDTFLNSLRFLTYQKTPTQVMNFPEGLSLNVPEKFAEDSTLENTDAFSRYSFLDRNSGVTFVLQVESLSRYNQASDGAKYFETVRENLFEEEETVFQEQSINGDLVGHEFWVKSKKVNSTKRVRFLLAGNKLISLWGYLPSDYKQSNLPDEVFNSLNATVTDSWSLFDDKTDLLLNDISSPDSLTRISARDALWDHPFEIPHLSQIYKALSQKYPEDDQMYNGTRSRLLNALKKIHDETTLPFVQNIYRQLPDTTQLRDKALDVLVAMNTESSVKAMVDLIREDANRKFNDYIVLSDFYDSIALINPVIEQLIELEPRFGDCYTLFDLVKKSLDSSALNPNVKQDVLNKVNTMAARLISSSLPAPEDQAYDELHNKFVNLARLLSALPFTPEVKDVVVKLHLLHDPEIMLTTSILMLKNNVPVSAKDLSAISANPIFRLQLYTGLLEIGRIKLFNKKHLTPKMIAESELYEYLYYEDGEPDQFQFMTEKKIEYNGTRQSIFIFKYTFIDDTEWYHGLSGPFPEKIKGNLPSGELTTTFYEQYANNQELLEEIKRYVEENGGKWLR
jgi:uncharacterized protein YbaP (TraB family)